jgi:asparagine synthase (glutamine-hydrolysing)
MCGICGTTEDRTGTATERMLGMLVHRGPDDAGLHLDDAGGAALGVRRLSIIDLQTGHQPLANEDRTVWAALNGEIYNYAALREHLARRGHRLATTGDTEVLVHLYEEFGAELVHAIEGMYAFAIWDARGRRLILARDRFGEKPLFYHHAGGRLTFASELTALVAGLTSSPDIDAAALDSFFALGYVPGPDTMLEGVRQVPPGHRLVWESGRLSEPEPYWTLPTAPGDGPPETEDLVRELAAILRRAVASRLVADVPVGVLLSGGVDSTLAAALAQEASSGRIRTYSVGYDVGAVDETPAARISARMIGAHHHEHILSANDAGERAPRVLRALDQPIADQALVALHAIAEIARHDVKVVVGGEGADELFAGYPRYRWLAHSARLDRALPQPVRAVVASGLRRAPLPGRLGRLSDVVGGANVLERNLGWVSAMPSVRRQLVYGQRLREAAVTSGQTGHLNGAAWTSGEAAAAVMALDQRQWLPDDVLAKGDRATMLASLELRTPYLERSVAEFAAGVPMRVHLGRSGKVLLRELLRTVLPEHRGSLTKTAFRVPAAEWLRGPLAPVVERQLAAGALFEEGWLSRDAVRELGRRHRDGSADHTQELWPVLSAGLWLDRLRGLDCA